MPRKSKSKPKSKAVRRDAYERALATAEKRLEKAKSELTKVAEKIAALHVEIPHLQSVIAVLSGRRQEVRPKEPYMAVQTPPVSANLKQYELPSLDGVGSIPHNPEDDTFLPDV